MRSGGRPTKFKPEFIETAIKLFEDGATQPELAQALGVSLRTVVAWIGQYPEFSRALKSSGAVADARVERSLYERATGYSYPAVKIMQREGKPILVEYIEHIPPDTTACIFWLKNRKRDEWRDVHRVEVAEAEIAKKVIERLDDGRKRLAHVVAIVTLPRSTQVETR